MESGIYKILNKVTGDFYIGSACKLERRKYEHFNLLTKNKHYNKFLQRSYNKYKDFEFIILFNCEKEELLKTEQSYLDLLKPVYNLTPVAGSMLGFKFSEKTKKIKSEQAAMQIKKAKENRLTNSKLLLTIEDVVEIKKLIAFNYSGEYISKLFKVASTTISAIKTKTTWFEIPDYIVDEKDKHLIIRTNQYSRLQKMNEEQRSEIINRVLSGETHINVSKDYNITKSGVGGIMRSYRKFKK